MNARFVLSRWVLVAGVLALLPLVACGGGTVEESATSETVPVTIEPARRGPVQSVVRATGVVAPAPGGEQIIGAPGPARIVEIPHGVGDRVRKGDVVVRFEIPSLQADVAARMSDLQRAQARLENARAALERVQSLFERGVAARKEVEDAQRELAEGEAALSEAKSAGSAAALSAQRLTVHALFDGVVAARAHNPGDLVDAANETILRILDPDRLEVNASIPARELSRIHEGSLATVAVSETDPPQPARVRSLPVSVDPLTAMATVRLDFVEDPHLPAGTPVQVAIIADERQDALVVPSGALVREGEDTFVYTVDAEGKAHRKKVTIGLVSDTDVEIVSGLEAGENVIVRGQAGLPDGAAVAPAS